MPVQNLEPLICVCGLGWCGRPDLNRSFRVCAH